MKLKRISGIVVAIPLALLAILILMLFNGFHTLYYDCVHDPNHVDDHQEPNTPK